MHTVQRLCTAAVTRQQEQQFIIADIIYLLLHNMPLRRTGILHVRELTELLLLLVVLTATTVS